MLIYCLRIFFSELSVYIFGPYHFLIVFLGVLSFDSSLCILDTSPFTVCVIYTYFFPVCSLCFHVINNAFHRANPISHFFFSVTDHAFGVICKNSA